MAHFTGSLKYDYFTKSGERGNIPYLHFCMQGCPKHLMTILVCKPTQHRWLPVIVTGNDKFKALFLIFPCPGPFNDLCFSGSKKACLHCLAQHLINPSCRHSGHKRPSWAWWLLLGGEVGRYSSQHDELGGPETQELVPHHCCQYPGVVEENSRGRLRGTDFPVLNIRVL